MKLNDAINIAEEVIKTDRVKTSYEERGKILKEVMPKIKSGNFSVKLRTDRVEDIEYIARLINNKDLSDYLNNFIETDINFKIASNLLLTDILSYFRQKYNNN